MTALGKVVRAGVGRRRVQTAVLVLTALIAVAASVLAAGLLVASSAPFDHGFNTQRGAQLTAQFDGTRATAAQLAATAHAHGVTAAAGPYPVISVGARPVGDSVFLPADFTGPPMTIVGRATAAPGVDDVTLTSGHWPTEPGQIVVDSNGNLPPEVQQLQFRGSPGSPTLTVVGVATSVSQTADAWVTPAQLQALTPPGSSPQYQMLYRFAHAGTDAEIVADRDAIAAATPHRALAGTQSWLAIKQKQAANTAAFVPFVVAFGVLGLALSVLIITIVVSSAVGAATRRIGILKSLGFTPAQVTRAYVAQALVPAGVGVVLGAVVGNLLAIPVLNGANTSYGTAGLSIPMWVNVLVPLAALAAVALAATVPALRAGRLRAAEAIAVGRSPRTGRGRLAQRVTGRLPVSRPIGLGLANPFARPARSALTAATVVFGAATVTFAVGLTLSLNAVQAHRELDSGGSVIVETGGPTNPGGGKGIHVPAPGNQPTASADPRAVAKTIAAQPGTASYYGLTSDQLSVSGIAGLTTVIGYQGDSSWATNGMVSGHWLDGPGQAIVTGRFLTAAGVQIGDTLTVSQGGRSTHVRIVGEVFTLSDDGMDVLTTTSTFAALGLDAQPDEFHVALKPGTSVASYLQSLNAALPQGAGAGANRAGQSEVIKAMDVLIGTLTVMLVIAAGLGVLNTVVLDTHERVHELGIVKALGMTPRQTVTMVLTSIAGIGLVAGAIGVPIGVALHHYVLPIMAHTTGENLPHVDVAVYQPVALGALVLGGLVIAVTGAFLPAGWAAGVRPSTALHTE